MPIFNPPPASSSSTSTPLAVDSGTTYTVSTNTQVCIANQLVTTGGIVLTADTGVITYVN